METAEFRQGILPYKHSMDPSTFINNFLDGREMYGDNLELRLQHMRIGQQEYQKRIAEYISEKN